MQVRLEGDVGRCIKPPKHLLRALQRGKGFLGGAPLSVLHTVRREGHHDFPPHDIAALALGSANPRSNSEVFRGELVVASAAVEHDEDLTRSQGCQGRVAMSSQRNCFEQFLHCRGSQRGFPNMGGCDRLPEAVNVEEDDAVSMLLRSLEEMMLR